MSQWWTYTLSDFLLFSPRTYYRLLELYNLAIWPLQLAGGAIGLGIVAMLALKRDRRRRIIALLLAGCWLWIAWGFHYERYAQINWAAEWFAVAFALQAIFLIVVGVMRRAASQASREGGNRLAATLVAITVLGYPLIAPLAGRPWTAAEAFGVAADPTAIGTIAALSTVGGRARWLLLILPLLWCAVAVATLWAMDAPETVVVAGAALLALVPAVCGMRRGDRDAKS